MKTKTKVLNRDLQSALGLRNVFDCVVTLFEKGFLTPGLMPNKKGRRIKEVNSCLKKAGLAGEYGSVKALADDCALVITMVGAGSNP